MKRPTIILVRPREEGNIGSVARAMANMGLDELVLVEPAPALGGVAKGFGVGGWEILDRCRRVLSLEEALGSFQRVVGTTSARDRPLRHTEVISSRSLPGFLRGDGSDVATALVFGPEDNGLTRAELELCEPVVAVPCDPRHPTLNLAQSVLLLAYELRMDRLEDPDEERAPPTEGSPASRRELEALLGRTEEVLLGLGYDQEPRRQTFLRELRRMALRGRASGRDVRLLLRLANRIQTVLGRLRRNAGGSGE